ncbi:MAG: hypothetical protein D6773_11365 [Alphaproteobacteria bacterium]|nr:MAG: hypothetical protein D6773_11365 [Alphaproteobacteria bacterium]
MPDIDHKEALQLIDHDWRADRTNREDALDDLRFVSGDQWDQVERQERDSNGRPALTINQLNKFVNQVAGDIRQGQPAIEVFPIDGETDPALAEIMEGLIRQIEYQSGAAAAYAHGAESAIRCGIGHWRILTEFVDDAAFEQEIKIKRVLDPLSVIWDASAVEIDRCDANHCWVIDWIPEREFKRRYKDREPVDLPASGQTDDTNLYWRREDFVRIAEYWYIEREPQQIALLQDGRTVNLTELGEEAELLRDTGQIVRERTAEIPRVRRRLMDGQGWLDDVEEWAGRHIPIVPVIGPEVAFDNRVIRYSLIRFAKDPQKLYNIFRSAGAELIAKSPKAPWLVTQDMVKGLEGYWNNANRSNLPYLPYNPDPNAPGAKPDRQEPPTIPTAIWQEALVAADDMKAATGIFDAALGARSNETSGRAILARQREGDVGSFIFVDNFRHAIRRTGQILVDLIPRIYDTQRQVRILNGQDESEFVAINATQIAVDGVPVVVNDLSAGRFDVRTAIGSSNTTARVEARELAAQALQGNPALWSVIGDLFFKYSDHPGAKEISERIKRTIPPQILGDDAPQSEPDPAEEILRRLALEEQAAKVEDIKSSALKKQADAGKAVAETERIVSEEAATTP